MSKYGVFSGPYFPTFALNTERYGVSLRIQSECGKIWTRKNSLFGQFSRSDDVTVKQTPLIKNQILLLDFLVLYQIFLKSFADIHFLKKISLPFHTFQIPRTYESGTIYNVMNELADAIFGIEQKRLILHRIN